MLSGTGICLAGAVVYLCEPRLRRPGVVAFATQWCLPVVELGAAR